MLIAIGTPLLDEFGGIQEAVAAIFRAIGQSIGDGEMGKLVGYIEGLAQDMERTLSAVARNLPDALASADFSGFIDGIEVVKRAVLDLLGGADLTTADGLKRAIEIVGTGFMTLSTFSANAIKAVGPFLEIMADLAKFVAELDPEIVKVAGSIGGIAIVATPVIGALASVAGGIQAVATGILGTSGLATALGSLATSPAAAALGLAALGTAAYALGTEIYRLTEHSQEYQKIQAEIAKAETERVRLSSDVEQALSDISKQTGMLIEDMDTFNHVVQSGALVWDEASNKWMTASQQASKGISEVKGELIDWGEKLKDLSGELEKSGKSANDVNAEYYALAGTTPELAKRMAELEGPVKKIDAVLAEAEKSSESFRIKMEELASNERIKGMELFTQLNIAQVENDTKRMEAALKSVDTVITEMNKGLVDMVGIFAGLDDNASFSKKWAIEEQIEKQNTRLDEQLGLQKQLVEEQVKSMAARRRALESGGALIKVDSTGLEPALEMVMWHILERIQLRVNEEASEFLIGLNP